MVAEAEKIFSFVKKMVYGIKTIFCVTKIIFIASEKTVAANVFSPGSAGVHAR
jgi:hypothetical protein